MSIDRVTSLKSSVAALLTSVLDNVSSHGPAAWRGTLAGRQDVTARLSADADWLLLEAVAPLPDQKGAEVDACKRTGALGLAKIVRDQDTWAYRLRAELPLAPDGSTSQLRSTLEGFTAACSNDSESTAQPLCVSRGTGAPHASALVQLRELCETTGWVFQPSDAGGVVEIVARGDTYDVHVSLSGGALRLSVPLALDIAPGTQTRAIAVLLLTTGGLLRMCRPYSSGTEAATLGLEVALFEPVEHEVVAALHALCAGCGLVGRECQALCDWHAANTYLMSQGLVTLAPVGQHRNGDSP